MGLVDLAQEIVRLGTKAKDGNLTVEDMVGGTFSITNGETTAFPRTCDPMQPTCSSTPLRAAAPRSQPAPPCFPGGVFGSLMSTPIINPPQSAILGMHGIFPRPAPQHAHTRPGSQPPSAAIRRSRGPPACSGPPSGPERRAHTAWVSRGGGAMAPALASFPVGPIPPLSALQVAVKGQVVIRPMMYVALTYDHRLIDGREAVTTLKRIKELCEDPKRFLLGC